MFITRDEDFVLSFPLTRKYRSVTVSPHNLKLIFFVFFLLDGACNKCQKELCRGLMLSSYFVDFKHLVAIEFRYDHGRRLTLLLPLPFTYEALKVLVP